MTTKPLKAYARLEETASPPRKSLQGTIKMHREEIQRLSKVGTPASKKRIEKLKDLIKDYTKRLARS